jgi:hypothetical protein
VPHVITVEAFTNDERERFREFLTAWGYSLSAILRYTLVFVKDDVKESATIDKTAADEGCPAQR